MKGAVPAWQAWRLEFDPRHKRSGDEIIIPVLGSPLSPTSLFGKSRTMRDTVSNKTKKEEPGIVVHTTFNPSPGESEARGSVSSRPTCLNA